MQHLVWDPFMNNLKTVKVIPSKLLYLWKRWSYAAQTRLIWKRRLSTTTYQKITAVGAALLEISSFKSCIFLVNEILHFCHIWLESLFDHIFSCDQGINPSLQSSYMWNSGLKILELYLSQMGLNRGCNIAKNIICDEKVAWLWRLMASPKLKVAAPNIDMLLSWSRALKWVPACICGVA